MNSEQVAALRALLAPTGWLDRTATFARALRRYARTPNGLLIFGTPDDEPWHITAHLADESRLAGIPELAPTLVRWEPPANAPAHLAVGLDRLRETTRQETLLVVTPQQATAEFLERVLDVKRSGATVFSLDTGDSELEDLAHESLVVEPGVAPVSFEGAQHLVSSSVVADPNALSDATRTRRAPRAGGEAAHHGGRHRAADPSSAGLRTKLARLLDAVSGTPTD
jgi:hypothetical protein